jgi:hypothetical protein
MRKAVSIHKPQKASLPASADNGPCPFPIPPWTPGLRRRPFSPRYVAVERGVADQALRGLSAGQVKGRSVKVRRL